MAVSFNGGGSRAKTRSKGNAVLDRQESSPQDIRWLQVRSDAEAAMRGVGLWTDALEPLLTEYVTALKAAEVARLEAQREPFKTVESGRTYANPAMGQWDTAVRRAMTLADLLGITPRGQKSAGAKPDKGPNPFARWVRDEFDELDELAAKRATTPQKKEGK